MSNKSLNYLMSLLITIVIVAALLTFVIVEIPFGTAICVVALAIFARLGIYSLFE